MSDPAASSIRATFGWDITYTCNYRCPYCTTWDQPTLLDLSVAEWTAVWRRIHERYGRCHIYLSGGEPSRYPRFYELIGELSRMHTIDVCTNLSWDVRRLVPLLAPEVLRIAPSFHPSFARFEEFFEKVLHAKEYMPNRPEGRAVYFVAHPSQIGRMKEYQARFAEGGFVLVPLPLVEAGGMGNNEGERSLIRDASPNKGDANAKLEYQLQEFSPRGRLCRAGRDYAMIRGDGGVDRCSVYKDKQLGRVYEKGFRLWEEPKVCEQDWCPYESQWLVEPAPCPEKR